MEAVIGVFVFLLGTFIGSFLNVVILRHNTGLTLGGRSFCFSCGKRLSWMELFPVFSYALQRGACRSCGSKISLQYPFVELLTGLLFTAVYVSVGPPLLSGFAAFLFSAAVFSLLVVIGVYDSKHKIIPDRFVFTFAALAFAALFVESFAHMSFQIPDAWALLAGPLVAAPFAFIWLVSGGRWMGLGDAKLSLGMGWLLGISSGFSALLFAVWIGALYGLAMVGVSHVYRWEQLSLFERFPQLTIKSEIPFGPFLILGFAIVYFTGFDLSALFQCWKQIL